MGPHRNKRVITRLQQSLAYAAWLSAYDGWVRAVVLPALGQPFYYQRPPTLRVAMPSAHRATIGVHRDADYHGHNASEINFWVPVTSALRPSDCATSMLLASNGVAAARSQLVPVADSSALWLESAPDRGDFAPRPLLVGECL
eukprot:3946965-Prymnesium_polylepis.1